MTTSRVLLLFALSSLVASAGCWGSLEAERARAAAAAARADAIAARDAAQAALTERAASQVASRGLRVWRDIEAEELCQTLGIKAVCFKYEGGWLAARIETDVDGQTTTWGEDEQLHRSANRQSALSESAAGQPTGSLIWVQRVENEYEAWDLVFRCHARSAAGDTRTSSKITLAAPHGPPQPREAGETHLDYGADQISLEPGQETALATLLTRDEKSGDVARTVKLIGKALE